MIINQTKDVNFSVVLIAPDIPQNTGNIARLCLATNCELVLVRPLGFRLTDQQLLRAGMDYWEKIAPTIFDSLEDFKRWAQNRRVFYLSAKGAKNYAQFSYQKGDVFCFGSESSGLPIELMEEGKKKETLLVLPMVEGVRCLNVSASASAVVYEGLRQLFQWGPTL